MRHAYIGLIVAAGNVAACADSADAPPPPSSKGGAITSFQPAGCEFSVVPRPEYLEPTAGKTDVGTNADIRRVRVGLGGNVGVGATGRADPSTSIGVAWQTAEDTLVTEIAWGKSDDPSTWSAADKTTGYTWLTPEGTINPNGNARMHEAYVCGLEPNTTYYYRVGGGGQWSDVHRFKTTPSDPSALKFLVSGDSRGQENDAWRVLQRRVMQSQVDLQLFSGDMINLATDQGEWEKWLDSAWKDEDGTLMSLGQVLTLAAHGNHEAYSSLFFGNMVLPQDPERYPSQGELFFSVDVGPVHFVVIDDGHIAFPDGEEESVATLTEWLRADLTAANANRAKVPWIVTMHHHASFSSSNHGDDSDVLRVREFFVPLHDEFHVDLELGGHDHNYERTFPLKGPAADPQVQTSPADGTVYMVCAGAGADAYSSGTSAFTEISRDYKMGGAIGFYAVVTASPTELTIEGHELRPDGSDPVFDTLTLTK